MRSIEVEQKKVGGGSSPGKQTVKTSLAAGNHVVRAKARQQAGDGVELC